MEAWMIIIIIIFIFVFLCIVCCIIWHFFLEQH